MFLQSKLTNGIRRAVSTRQMENSILVVAGSGRLEFTGLSAVAAEFGWIVRSAHDVREAATMEASSHIVAVFLDRDALGPGYSWPAAIRHLRVSFPRVRLVTCHGFGDTFDWPELCDAGAFHALSLPAREEELRQSLGFIWEAEKRAAAGRNLHIASAA
jgi:DNA-binding NtrC family response regulator